MFALTFIKGYRPLVFHIPFWTGVAFGVVMQLSSSPCCKDSMDVSGFKIGGGHYALLLGFNVVSTVVCWALGGLALLDNRAGRDLGTVAGDEEGDDDTTGPFSSSKECSAGDDHLPTLPVKHPEALP